MTLADELAKLEQQHARGSLSDMEFSQAKSRLLQAPLTAPPRITALNGLRRSGADRWIGGVCGGLAAFTGMDSWLWRLFFALTLMAGGIGFILYVLLWLLVPLEADAQPSSHP
jgi:phage shock protein PspC (stress-responsive transcriptional regulator)